MYTLDTNVIIYYANDDPAVVQKVRRILQAGVVYVATITELELFSYSGLTSEDEHRLREFLRGVAVVPLDSQIAQMAAKLRRQYGLEVADSAIAATALFTNTILATRNVQDFRRVSSLSLGVI